jgi:flagella basal body P-ring formation protein FlgA
MFLNDLLSKMIFILFSLLIPVEVWAAVPVKPVEIRFEKEISVSTDSVVLGDVATIYAKSMKDFQVLSGLVISDFSGDRAEVRVPQGYLESRIREALPAGTEFQVRGPALVTFRREGSGSPFALFASELEKKARAEGKIPAWAEVSIEPLLGFDAIAGAKFSDLRLEPAAILNQWKGDLTFRAAKTGGADFSWLKVKVRWFAEVWQAGRGLGLLTKISPQDFVRARAEVTQLREEPVLASADIESLVGNARLRRSLVGGAPLVMAALEKAPDARTGQSLKVVFVSESGIRVSADGALLGSGAVGDEVRAKLRSSRKIVTGKLVSGGVMEVSL